MGVIDPASEILERLRRSKLGDNEGGMTVMEIAESIGVSRVRAGAIVSQAVRQGVLAYAGKREGRRVDGSVYWIPVYRAVVANQPKRGRKACGR